MFERAAIAKLVAALAEFDRRRLFLPLGFTSLFSYCTNRLGLSQDEAFHRIEAARVARRFPLTLAYLEKGAITLTTARLLGPHLTADNCRSLLETASHQKKPEVEMLIARLQPKPDVPSTLRKLPDIAVADSVRMLARQAAATSIGALAASPGPASMSTSATSGIAASATSGIAASATSGIATAAPSLAGRPASAGLTRPVSSVSPASTRADSAAGPPTASGDGRTGTPRDVAAPALEGFGPLPRSAADIPGRRPVVAPLSESSYRLQITISKTTHDRLREIQALMRHVIPTGDPAAIVERSLALLLADLKKKKAALVDRPRSEAGSEPRGRHIPARVKRSVWNRDGGRCAFVSSDGARCGEDGFLEFHHVKPFARGGRATAANIQLRCRAHNVHESDVVFGRRMRR